MVPIDKLARVAQLLMWDEMSEVDKIRRAYESCREWQRTRRRNRFANRAPHIRVLLLREASQALAPPNKHHEDDGGRRCKKESQRDAKSGDAGAHIHVRRSTRRGRRRGGCHASPARGRWRGTRAASLCSGSSPLFGMFLFLARGAQTGVTPTQLLMCLFFLVSGVSPHIAYAIEVRQL